MMDIEKNLSPEINQISPKTITELLAEKEPCLISVKEIIFLDPKDPLPNRPTKPIPKSGQPNRLGAQIDHYNQSEPITIDNQEIILTREEPRSSEISACKFYLHNTANDAWEPMPSTEPMLGYQDPSYIGQINNQKYFTAINTEADKSGNIINYWSELFLIKDDVNNIEKIAQGPSKSKGLRLIQTATDNIEGFIRMQGGRFERGKICHFQISSIEELPETLSKIEESPEIVDIFDSSEWGGVNDLHQLPDGRIGVLGHIARFVTDTGEDKKEYYIITAIYDPKTKSMSDLKIILGRKDIKIEAEAKRPDLENVLYPTNSVLENNKLHIYASVADTKPIVVTVVNPWQQVYDKL